MEADIEHTRDREAAANMGLPYMTSFLWCLTLNTGTKLIAILHLGLSGTTVVVCSLAAADARALARDDGPDRLYSSAFYVSLAVATVSMVHVMLASTLMYGAFLRKTAALRFWVLVMLVLYVAAILFILVTAILCGFNSSGSDIFLSFLEGILLFAFIGYCILCVYSYYLMLKSTEDMDHPNKTDY